MERYRLFGVKLFGLDWILAMESPDLESCSPQEYARHVGLLEARLRGKRVVLVMSSMPPSSRNRLIQAGLPFVVPGIQMFIPPFALELRRSRPAQAALQNNRWEK